MNLYYYYNLHIFSIYLFLFIHLLAVMAVDGADV